MIRRKISIFTRLTQLLLVAILALLWGCGEQRFQPREAPDFTLPLLDKRLDQRSDQRLGESGTVSPGDYRGQVVYLTFWASWCVPCRQEMPYLAQLWERHREQGFQVLAINVDEDVALARAFVQEYNMQFPVLLDTDREVSKLYRVPGFPTHYVIDRRGRIRFSGLGFNLNDLRAVTQEVETLLDEE